MSDLFTPQIGDRKPEVIDLGNGVFHIKQLVPSHLFFHHINLIAEQAPFRKMMTPMGHSTQVSMTNCGHYGWISDKNGYRYSPVDPISEKAWPNLPAEFLQIHRYACQLAGIPFFMPDACLINRYEIGLAMGRHQDKDEKNTSWPIVSISLGLSAVFQIFSAQRTGPAQNVLLEDGDVVILSGLSRHFYHGIKPVKADPLQPNCLLRYNLTLRKSH